MGKASNEVNKKEIVARLHCMMYSKNCSEKLIIQLSRRIWELQSHYHWYQLIIWNNFLRGVFNFGDFEWTKKESKIQFVQEAEANKRELLDKYSNSLNISVVSLVCVDYLIERLFAIDQRDYPLENKVVAILEKRAQEVHNNHLLQMSRVTEPSRDRPLWETNAQLQQKQGDLFDILCNILSIFGENCGHTIVSNSDTIGELFDRQAVRFDAVFDFFKRLKMHEIYAPGSERQIGSVGDIDVKSDRKEEKEDKREEENGCGIDTTRIGVTNFMLSYFGPSVEKIDQKESIDRLCELLYDYKWFISSSSSADLRHRFYKSIAKNKHLCYDPRFIPYIKHIIKKNYNDDEMSEWCLSYWDKHGIKAVVDIIYQCEFKFDIFCAVLKTYSDKMKNVIICKFEEWLEVIVCRNIGDSTKRVVCENPPLTLKDILTMKDEKKKNEHLERLRLVLVEDQDENESEHDKAKKLGFGEGLEMPLMKYGKVGTCNPLMEHLMGDIFPDIDINSPKPSVHRDKQIISFFASKIGQEVIMFLHQINETVGKRYGKDISLKYCTGKITSFHKYWKRICQKLSFTNKNDSIDSKLGFSGLFGCCCCCCCDAVL